MNKLTKYLIIFGILVLILGQGGLLGAVFGFIVSKVKAFSASSGKTPYEVMLSYTLAIKE